MSSDETTRLGAVGAKGVGPGTQLNGIYEIDELIAAGGMGEVYKGHNIRNKSPVAIKIILPELANDDTVLSLFERESETLHGLSHDAIVRYHVFAADPVIDRPYLSMEFVDGVPLADYMKEKPLSLEGIQRLLIRLCEGLQAAHEAGVIHRDLSPDNVILPKGKLRRAKIIDFGIAKSTAEGHRTLLGGKFAGKYNFVSPEQLGRYDGIVTNKSDIYSLALVAAAAVRGKALDMGGSPVEVVEKRATVPDISDVHAAIRPLLEAMLQPDPANRPESMADIVEWLKAMPIDETATVDGEPAGSAATVLPGTTGVGHSLTPGSLPPQTGAGGSLPPQSVAGRSMPPLPGTSQLPRTSQFPTDSQLSQAPISVAPQEPAPAPQPESESPFGPATTEPQSYATVNEALKPQKRSSSLPLVAALALLLIVGGGAAYYWFVMRGDPAEQVAVTTPTTGETGTGSETTDPVVEPKPVDPAQIVAQRLAWIRSYDSGACTFVRAEQVTPEDATIEAFGQTAEAFNSMVAAFEQAHGVRPQIRFREIRKEQCPVTAFLAASRPANEDAITLELTNRVIKSGDQLIGVMQGHGDKQLNVLLVDTDGFVYNLDGFVSRASALAKLDVPLSYPAPQPVPQLLIAVTSNAQVAAMNPGEPLAAETFFKAVDTELKSSGTSVTAAVQHFRIEAE